MQARHTADPDDIRERDLDRLLTFVDAIVAIAITLLVLPLVEIAADVQERSVGSVLAEHRDQIGSFLLSFVVVARLWWAQHAAVRPLRALPPRLFTALMAWTLTVVFLPFPTALVAQSGDQALVKVLYIGTTALSMTLLVLIDLVVAHHPECATAGTTLPLVGVTAVNAALLWLALAIAVLIPATSYLPMLLLALDRPVVRLLGIERRTT